MKLTIRTKIESLVVTTAVTARYFIFGITKYTINGNIYRCIPWDLEPGQIECIINHQKTTLKNTNEWSRPNGILSNI